MTKIEELKNLLKDHQEAQELETLIRAKGLEITRGNAEAYAGALYSFFNYYYREDDGAAEALDYLRKFLSSLKKGFYSRYCGLELSAFEDMDRKREEEDRRNFRRLGKFCGYLALDPHRGNKRAALKTFREFGDSCNPYRAVYLNDSPKYYTETLEEFRGFINILKLFGE